jgi:hypothetical protein
VFDGGNTAKAKGHYKPILLRDRQEPVEVVNERYAKKRGLDLMKAKLKEEARLKQEARLKEEARFREEARNVEDARNAEVGP